METSTPASTPYSPAAPRGWPRSLAEGAALLALVAAVSQVSVRWFVPFRAYGLPFLAIHLLAWLAARRLTAPQHRGSWSRRVARVLAHVQLALAALAVVRAAGLFDHFALLPERADDLVSLLLFWSRLTVPVLLTLALYAHVSLAARDLLGGRAWLGAAVAGAAVTIHLCTYFVLLAVEDEAAHLFAFGLYNPLGGVGSIGAAVAFWDVFEPNSVYPLRELLRSTFGWFTIVGALAPLVACAAMAHLAARLRPHDPAQAT